MILILDAYNVIHKIRDLEARLDRDLRSAREELIRRSEKLLSERGDIREVILVFDGKSQYRDLEMPTGPGLQAVFTETGEDADTRIVKILEDLGSSVRVCVVSDDNFVNNHSRAYGADVMKVAGFEDLLERGSRKKPARSGPKPRAGLAPDTARAITEEYRKKLGL